MHEILDVITRSNESAVLATIINVEGSAYRKTGAAMLFMENGRQVGMISAGCLESDLAIQANKLLEGTSICSRMIVYDMSAEDDLSWGRGAGCNGNVHMLLETVNPVLREQLCIVKEYLDKGIPVVSLKVLKQIPGAIDTAYITQDEQIFGNQNIVSQQLMLTALEERKSCIIDDAEVNTYLHFFKPKPRLFIFGAGPDARPFSQVAAQTGFKVNIWDWRSAYKSHDYFPDARFLGSERISETIENLDMVASDSVILMTHDFQKDREILHALLKQKQISYLGVLGPRKRTTRLLSGATIPKYLHSPVGLAIGAEGPEEIAISIIAALIQAQRQG